MAAVSESLKRALQHHEAGELDRAEALYEEIIRVDPGHIDALHLLGVAAHQKADHRTAADLIRRAIAHGGRSALYHSNLGTCYRSMNRLPEAIAAFREAVNLEPRFPGARYNLAMALESAGSHDEAIAEYREVLRIEPGFVRALNNLGSLLASQGRFEQAIESFRRAIDASPESAEFHYNLANVLSRAGRCEEAVAAYKESIRLNPRIPETYNNLATALNSLGRRQEGLAALDTALQLRPDFAEAELNRSTIQQASRDIDGVAAPAAHSLPVAASPPQWCQKGSQLQDEGRSDEAAACFRRALELDANCASAHFGLGYGLLLAEKHAEASAHYEQGLLIDDGNAAAWNNLGSIYTALEQWEDAIACYESALQIDAANVKAHYNLGNVYKDIGRLSDASACYRRSLYIDPSLVEAHINLGVVLQQQGRLADASASHSRAVHLRPNDPEAHFHRALTWLLMGDFEKGWAEYEWRWLYDTTPRDFGAPVWDGSDLAGKTILVYAEQGLGDEVLFASCLQDVIDAASQCLIECDPRLVPLYARSFPAADVVAKPLSVQDAAAYGIDVQCAAGSLPGVLRRGLDSFPRRRQFLSACPARRLEWSRRYSALGAGLKVGIAWRGGSKPAIKRRRSTTLEQWKPLFNVAGIRFVNLQYGDCEAEIADARSAQGSAIHQWPDADPLKDLEGLAAQIAELDLVISVDNATVHLAGALGVPVWTLLHFSPNWRWLLERDDSPWYPSMALLRQPAFNEWDPVFQTAAERLQRLATSRVSKTSSGRSQVRDRLGLGQPQTATRPVAIQSAPAGDAQANEERAKYERVWAFDNYRRFSPGAAALEQVSLVEALRKMGVRTILDAGCGTGRLMWRLMQEHAGEFDVHGFDITDACLDPCFASIKDKILTVGCLWNPDDFTKTYDAVICTDVMEHIPTERVPAVLENLRRSTRKLAYLSISVVPDSFGPQLIGEPLHLTIKKPNWWFAKLALAGFKVVSHAVGRSGDGSDAQLHVFATV